MVVQFHPLETRIHNDQIWIWLHVPFAFHRIQKNNTSLFRCQGLFFTNDRNLLERNVQGNSLHPRSVKNRTRQRNQNRNQSKHFLTPSLLRECLILLGLCIKDNTSAEISKGLNHLFFKTLQKSLFGNVVKGLEEKNKKNLV